MVTVLNGILNTPISWKIKESPMALQDVDDSIFISNGDWRSLISFKLLLRAFSTISGLTTNFTKSSMVAFNMQEEEAGIAEAILGYKRESLLITYLIMPLTITAPKRSDFMSLIERFERRLQGWQGKMLSRGGGGFNSLAQSYLSYLSIIWAVSSYRLG